MFKPLMHRIQHVWIHRVARYPLRNQCTTHFKPRSSSISKTIHNPSGEHTSKSPRWKWARYGGAATAIGLIAFSAVWAASPIRSNPVVLDERRFTPFSIVSKDPVSSTSALFALQPLVGPPAADDADPYAPHWARGVWSVEFKQPQLQIARAYTPLPPPAARPAGTALSFLIRREHRGEVSGYLDRLPVGATVDIRGPRAEFDIPPDVRDVVFLAGGTGIAPALQVVYTLLSARECVGEGKDDCGPRIHVLWANRRREDCSGGKEESQSRNWWRPWQVLTNATRPRTPATPNRLTQELLALEKKHAGQLVIDYFVDEEGSFIDAPQILRATHASRDACPGRKLLLVAGPNGFVEYFAGPWEWVREKQVQGPVGGLLGRLGLSGWTVMKL